MSKKTDSAVCIDSIGAAMFSESDVDEDLDLTDTKLLHISDEEQEYTAMHVTTATEEHKDSPILILDDNETENDLSYLQPDADDLPDYESPAEDDSGDIKSAHLDRPVKTDIGHLADDELPEISAQDTDDDDDYYFHGSAIRKTKMEKFNVARIAPYSAKNRNQCGKGKRPLSGRCRFKSNNTKVKSPIASDTNEELTISDLGRPACFGDDTVDISSQIQEEEKLSVPAVPMLCECCDKEEGHNSMVQCCDDHIVCTRCVEASAKKVLVGEKTGPVECPQSQCSSTIPMSELRKALPAIVLDLIEDRWNKETLEALENMKDVVKCPGCSYSAVLDISLKRFQCIQCNEAFCRYCESKWNERKTHDLCIRTKQWTSTVTGNVVNIPARWCDVTTDSTIGKTESHTMVKLDTSSEEFLDVVHCMNKYLRVTVKKIYRVQNERLWEKYSLTRSHMVADLGELNINEMRLFHGTHRDVIEAICREGFDWRLCGKHGTIYGQGTYFARSPVTSHRYSSGFSSRRGRNAFIGGLFFHGSRIPPPNLRTPSHNKGFIFGAPTGTTQSSGFTFGGPIASNTMHNSSAGIGFNPNPLFRFGSTLAGSSSGSSTSVGLFGAAHSKHCNKVSPGDISGNNNNNLSTAPDLHNKAASSRQCSDCIFCTNKKKQNAEDMVKKMLIECSGSKDTESANNVNRNKDHSCLPYQTAKIQTQKNPVIRVVSDSSLQYNTGAHLFVRSVPPTSAFGFPTGGNDGNGSHMHFGSGNSNSNGGPSNSRSSGSSSGNFGLFNDDTDNSDSDDCFMFLARVLVGRSCIGSHEMRRPSRNIEGQETHSAVDKEQEPTIFVIFDNNQCYPEYIIQYSTKSN